MTHSSNEQAEIILRKDKEWSLIDSELCLVTNFSPVFASLTSSRCFQYSWNIIPYVLVDLNNFEPFAYFVHLQP